MANKSGFMPEHLVPTTLNHTKFMTFTQPKPDDHLLELKTRNLPPQILMTFWHWCSNQLPSSPFSLKSRVIPSKGAELYENGSPLIKVLQFNYFRTRTLTHHLGVDQKGDPRTISALKWRTLFLSSGEKGPTPTQGYLCAGVEWPSPPSWTIKSAFSSPEKKVYFYFYEQRILSGTFFQLSLTNHL